MSLELVALECLKGAKVRLRLFVGVSQPIKKNKKTNKYGATKTTIDGIMFDSKVEARYYLQLKKKESRILRCKKYLYYKTSL